MRQSVADIEQTKELVKKYITCLRHSWLPAYPHSWWVGEKLLRYWFSQVIVIAWLLHDIIEDSTMTREWLRELWYSDDVLSIVDVVTHDDSIMDNSEKRSAMMLRCIDIGSKDVRAVKIADFRDNIQDFEWCSLQHIQKMLLKRAPLFLYYGNLYFQGTKFYNDFMDEYRIQIKSYYNYFI